MKVHLKYPFRNLYSMDGQIRIGRTGLNPAGNNYYKMLTWRAHRAKGVPMQYVLRFMDNMYPCQWMKCKRKRKKTFLGGLHARRTKGLGLLPKIRPVTRGPSAFQRRRFRRFPWGRAARPPSVLLASSRAPSGGRGRKVPAGLHVARELQDRMLEAFHRLVDLPGPGGSWRMCQAGA